MTYTDNEIRDLILKFEKQCNPFKYQVDDFCIWPVFKFPTFEDLKTNQGNHSRRESPPRAFFVARWFSKVTIIPSEIIKLFRLRFYRKAPVLCLTSDNRLRDEIDGLHKNSYFDFFEPPIKNAIYWYEISNNLDKLKDGNIYYLDSRAISFLCLFSFLKVNKHAKIVLELFKEFSDFIQQQGYIDITVQSSHWLNLFYRYLRQRYYFHKILWFISPQVLLIECFYGKEGAIAAAKSMEIPVWELQHGVVYDSHMAYTYDNETARSYRDNLPLPDKILTFGTYFSKIFTNRDFWQKKNIVSIGFPRLEYFQKKYRPRKKPSQNLQVLLSTQWIIADKLLAFLKESLEKLPADIIINLKLHPLDPTSTSKRYEKLVGSSLNIISPKDSFYDALLKCDVHCSVFSTTLFESVGMSIPTLVIDLPGAEHVYPLVEHGCAKKVSSPQDLINVLLKAKQKKGYLQQWQKDTKQKSSFFWKQNSSQRLQQLMSSLQK